jgi:putative membrane protein
MTTKIIATRQVLVLLPALIHVYIFVLESLLWARADEQTVCNQRGRCTDDAGKVLAAYGLGSILVAGVMLVASSPKLWKSALIQIVPATAGLAALLA